jgi:hypothetical protein
MPFLGAALPWIIGIGGAASAGASVVSALKGSGGSRTSTPNSRSGRPTDVTDIAGRNIDDDAILPGVVNPTYPQLQQDWGKWLQSMLGQGLPAYPGTLNPNLAATRLPEVWNAWQPWDGGMQQIANTLAALKPGEYSPLTQQLMQWGGTGGEGHKLQKATAQFGAPTPESGLYAANLAQFGVTSPGAGQPLVDLAYGRPTGAAAYLLPFLTANSGGGYRAPSVIPSKQITRKT